MSKSNSYCKNLDINSNKDDFIIPSKDNKWFFTFLVTLLNEKSFELINNKNYTTDQANLYAIIKDPFPIIQYNKEHVSKFIKSMNTKYNITDQLYKYLIDNNLYNYFLLPFYLKFLGFSCITFEYLNEKIYGGAYNYLKSYTGKDGKKYYSIDIANMRKSNGLKYDQRKNYNPEYLLINIWNDNDPIIKSLILNDLIEYNLNKNSIIDDDTKIPLKKIEYNGYEYILTSQLLTNYNTNEYKKPEHTISVTNCSKKTYAFSNSFYKIKDIKGNVKAYFKSLIPANTFEEKPCTRLIELSKPNKKMLLSENSCELNNGNKKITENDEKYNYCFSIKKGKRVLMYIKGDKIKTKEEIAIEKAEEAELKKKLDEAKKAAEQEAKDAKSKKVETQEEKAERLEKEKLCNTINDYLKKIKTNKNNEIILEKIKTEKDYISRQLKELGDKEKRYESNKAELLKLKEEIDKGQQGNIKEMAEMMKKFKAEINYIPNQAKKKISPKIQMKSA